PVRVVRLRDEHGAEALRAFTGLRVPHVDLELVRAFGVEDDRPLRAVDLPAHLILAAEGEPGRLVGPDRAVLELDRRLERVVDVDGAAGPLPDERPRAA